MAVSGVSLYVGAAIAVGLFDVFPPALVAWLRISAAALVLLVLRRPTWLAFIGKAGATATVYGVATLGMNMSFYVAISHIPLGTAVAIEFLGPVLVAALGSRGLRDWAALLLASLGVLIISGATWSENAAGIFFALLAGGLWAGYIVIGAKLATATQDSGAAMAVGFSWAAVLTLPYALWAWPAEASLGEPRVLGLWLALGILSAAVPYSLDQVVLRLSGASYFAVLQAILPMAAALVGAIALGQWLSVAEACGIAVIVVAVALRQPASSSKHVAKEKTRKKREER